ncbi:hypothetical protein [Micromonospora sp. NPDC047074]|uniref:hypothetical protein n=1 Tax=Micromonospora sp. NPDC047074 TaxID=3154339 RepID=UPI0034000C69
MHGRYARRLADVRLGGHEVLVALTVRRFVCGSSCQRRHLSSRCPARLVGMPVRPSWRRATWKPSRWRWAVERAAGWRSGWRCRCRG